MQENTRSTLIEMLGDLGVGGERGIVYGVGGVLPSQSATQHKDAIKVVEILKYDKGSNKWIKQE